MRINNFSLVYLKHVFYISLFLGQISLADVQVFCILHDLIPAVIGLGLGGLDLKDHPHLAAFLDRFKSEEKISQWIKKRPVTSF